jgi:ATP-binding cassette subfamily B protein
LHVRRRVLLSMVSTAAAALATALGLGLLLVLVDRGDVNLADAGAAAVALPLLGSRLTQAFGGLGNVLESGLFLGDLDAFLALRPAALNARGRETAPPGFERLRVENLSFTYPGSDRPAVQDISLHIRRGEVIALVGENGSGKTTLAKLLARLYEPDAGRVIWDDRDALSFDPESLRAAIAVIFQDFLRYELTAAENIGLGRPEKVDDRSSIEVAAVHAGADRVVRDLPMAYDTLLTRAYAGGRDLSLGQWQRIALARAFFRDAQFVILDEPSAALDARAEHELFGTIRTLLEDRTVLLISHRFSTVRTADRIYVLHEGRIVESGNHEALMACNGLYREMFDLQASAYLDEGVT